MAIDKLIIDGDSLTLDNVEYFLLNNQKVEIAPAAIEKINKSRALVDRWVENEKVIYGVTTGFGEFANVSILKDKIRQLQENLILSHAVGCGEELAPYIVKIMMLLRLNALAKGYSGIRLSTLNTLVEMINNNIIPVVPAQGSVGSSGDLVQLAHLVLGMIGKGRVRVLEDVMNITNEEDAFGSGMGNIPYGKPISSEEGLKKFNLVPVVLEAKEGLALINGTQMMTAHAVFISIRARKMVKIADIAAALSFEALRGTDKAYNDKIHQLRPFPGQINCATNLRALIKDSQIRASHFENDTRVQDAYSLRCVPQIHGASRDAVEYVCSRVEIEMNSVNDNPIIIPETEEHIEGGNFHGQSMALAMDFMGIALSELANVSERRTERLVNGNLSFGLPRFLTKHGGLNSGLMIAQYTAASLVSENKVLAHPASVDSIPTSANQEDHNSMGSIAARKCLRILHNLENVHAIELLSSTQGIDFLAPLKPGTGTNAAYEEIRKHVTHIEEDRLLYNDIKKINALIKTDVILNRVEEKINLV